MKLKKIFSVLIIILSVHIFASDKSKIILFEIKHCEVQIRGQYSTKDKC